MVGLAAFLIAHAGVDLEAARRVLGRSGSGLAVLVIPFLLVAWLDGIAWTYALDLPFAARRSLPLVARIRIALESIALTIPGSALASDGVAPTLLRRLTGADLESTVSGVALKKWGFVVGHVLLLTFACLVGGTYFARLDHSLDLGVAPRAAIGTAALVGAIACFGFSYALRSGLAERIRRAISALPIAALARRANALSGSVRRADATVRGFFEGRRSRVGGLIAISTAVWIAESFEVYVMLRVLGVSPAPEDVLAMEAFLTVIRGLAIVSPGALGVQEVAYMSFVPSLGLGSTELASALVVLRRMRDLVCIAVGYLLVANLVRSPTRAALVTPDVTGIA